MKALALGLLLGFSIAVPVGPMALLAVQQTLVRGVRQGLWSALGAACGDAVYGAAAALGLSLATSLVAAHKPALRIAGGVVLLGLGVLASRAPLPEARTVAAGRGLFGAWAAGFLLTVTNPITVLTFTSILVESSIDGAAAPIVLGVLCGSFLWYAGLCAAAHWLRAALQRRLRQIRAGTIALFVLAGGVSLIGGALELAHQPVLH